MLQPPYSPDLAPSDFHLFGPPKDGLRGHHFEIDVDVKHVVMEWMKKTESAFFFLERMQGVGPSASRSVHKLVVTVLTAEVFINSASWTCESFNVLSLFI